MVYFSTQKKVLDFVSLTRKSVLPSLQKECKVLVNNVREIGKQRVPSSMCIYFADVFLFDVTCPIIFFKETVYKRKVKI